MGFHSIDLVTGNLVHLDETTPGEATVDRGRADRSGMVITTACGRRGGSVRGRSHQWLGGAYAALIPAPVK